MDTFEGDEFIDGVEPLDDCMLGMTPLDEYGGTPTRVDVVEYGVDGLRESVFQRGFREEFPAEDG